MKTVLISCSIIILAILSSSGQSLSQSTGADDASCSITAEGELQNGDTFGGNISKRQDGNIDGAWHHQTPTGDNFFISKIDWIVASQSSKEDAASDEKTGYFKFGGSGKRNNIEGYTFRALAENHDGDEGREHYSIAVFRQDGTRIYNSSGHVVSGIIRRIVTNCPSSELEY